jgi:uncharacterized protein (DUF608 family)
MAGRLENVDMGDQTGLVGNIGAERLARLRRGLPFGFLAHQINLPSGEERTVTFMLAWHFLNHTEADYLEKKRQGQIIGHQYANSFTSAAEVVQYGVTEKDRLVQDTHAFFDHYYQSSFDGWVLEAAAAQLSTLIKSSWWDRQGRFGIWEGLGCCGLQTTDITYYGSFPILLFFPELQKSQMRLTRDNIEIPGKIPHMMPGNFSVADVDHRGRIDLIPQYILLVWRDVLWTGDLDYAREMWPSITDALAYFATLDTDGDGLPNNTGPDQTYDQFPLLGTSAFVGYLFAASLLAAAQLADLLDLSAAAAALRQQLEQALQTLDAQLWNGSYYRLCFDSASGTANEGVMADQINGDWFVRQVTGSGLLRLEKVQQALSTIRSACLKPEGYLSNCAWPAGGEITIGRHTSDQANSPWSGVEYALAAHLLLAGEEQSGLDITQVVWQRYERAGLRFNHIECGANYYRALSSWAVYLALTGFSYNAFDQSLSLGQAAKPARFVFNLPTAWGECSNSETEQTITLLVHAGSFPLKSLHLGVDFSSLVHAELDGQPLAAAVHTHNRLVFAQPVLLQAGQQLQIRI